MARLDCTDCKFKNTDHVPVPFRPATRCTVMGNRVAECKFGLPCWCPLNNDKDIVNLSEYYHNRGY